MAIDRAQVRKVAHLARLELTADEEEKFAAQLSHVLGYIEKLSAVDVSGVSPLSFAGDVPGAAGGQSAAQVARALLREDTVQGSLPREEALRGAPQSDGASFLVPRILE